MSDNEDVGSEPTCFIISPGLKAPPPTKDAPPSDSPDVGSAVLQLKQFAERPILEFGSVELGGYKTLYLDIRNDALLVQHITVDKLPAGQGFSLSADPDLPPAASLSWGAHVAPQDRRHLPVTWQPQEAGPLAEVLSFKLDGKHRLQVKLVGTAVRKPKQDAAKPRRATDQRATATAAAGAAAAAAAAATGFRRPGSGIAGGRPLATGPSRASTAAATGAGAGGTGHEGAGAAAPSSRPPSSAGGFSRPASTASSVAGSTVSTRPVAGGSLARPVAATPRSIAAGVPATPRSTSGGAAVAAAAGSRPGTSSGGSSGAATGSSAAPAAAGGAPAFKVPAPRPAAGAPPPSKLRLKPRTSTSTTAPMTTAAAASAAAGPADHSKAAVAAWLGSPGGSSAWPHAAAAAAAARGGGGAPSVRSSSRGSPTTLGSRSKTGSKARKTFSYFHTELWMAKQDKAFSAWLNHLLLPYTPDALRHTLEDEQSAALTDLRLAAQVQGCLVACYRTDPDLREVMMKVEKRVDDGRMQLKREALACGDIQMYKGALEALLSYNPFWLRLGMEVLTQRAVVPPPGTAQSGGKGPGAAALKPAPGLAEALRCFAEAHFLGDQDLREEMEAGRGAAHYDMDQYWRDVGDLVLKRFLLLALLLDKVAGRLADRPQVPLLFRIDGTIKSSSQAVMAFLHGRMVGEGNVLRHLEMLGYRLAYVQSPLTEYPWGVSNLAVDLRDGLRLARLAALLAGGEDLMSQVRFPSDKRPVQLHNSALALATLSAAGVAVDALPTSRGLASLTPEDLVDGDRERSLALLWAVARALQLPRLVPIATLRAELARVLARGRRLRRQQQQQQLSDGRLNGAGVAADAGAAPLVVYMKDELVSLLLQWVQAVAAQQGVAVQNFTSCFGDGRVLCLLVAYYLPNALDLSEVYNPDPATIPGTAAAAAAGVGAEPSAAGPGDGASSFLGAESSFASLPGRPPSSLGRPSSSMSFATAPPGAGGAAGGAPAPVGSPGGYGEDVVIRPGGWCAMFDATGCIEDDAGEQHRRGVARNFAMVHRAARSLGGVPEMLSAGDFLEHGLDERAVILYVSFLCSRLLEVSREERAAHTIQEAWRNHKANSIGAARAHLHRWVAATATIQRAVKAWLFRRGVERLFQQRRRTLAAVVALQARWRGRLARRVFLRQRAAAVVIQRTWRTQLAHGTKRQQAAALTIQSAWRGHQARQQYGWMARFLQRCLVAAARLQQARREAKLLRAVVTCQATYRGAKQQRGYQKARAAAVGVQAAWRMQVAMRGLAAARGAAVVVQSSWRRHAARSSFLEQRAAATAVQAAWRGHAVRQQQAQLAAAATVLQAAYRGRAVRQLLAESAGFATFLQACYRCQRARSAFLRLRAATVVLQAAWRGRQVRSRLAEQQQAATMLQAAWRGRQVRQQQQREAAAALLLQSFWRMRQQQQQYQVVRQKVLLLQAHVRGHLACRRFKQQVAAVTLVQALYRGQRVRRQLAEQAAAATTIQAAWRCCQQHQQYEQLRAAAVCLQTGWRSRCARRQLSQQRAAAVCLQGAWRCRAARQLLQQHRAAVVIQSRWRAAVAQAQWRQQRAGAVVVQAAVRGWLAKRSYQRQVQQLVVLQAAVRGWQQRKWLQQQQAAAVAVQAAWRGHSVRQQVAKQAAAAVCLQRIWRGRCVRSELQQQATAATTIQASFRGWCIRQDLQQQSAAAVVLQASWRGRCIRSALAQQQAAAVVLQAAWRRHAAQAAYQRQQQVAVALQAAVRMQQQRRSYLGLRAAAAVLQAAERGRQARRRLLQERAARRIQTEWRRVAARREAAARRAAVLVIQKNARVLIAKRQVQVMRTYEASCKELRSMLLMLHTRMRAATLIQATWRGHVQRKLFQPVWQQYQEGKARLAAAVTLQRAWRARQVRLALGQQAAALATLTAWVPALRARLAFWRARRAAVVLQRAWRVQAARREAAAIVIQSWARGAAARRRTRHQVDSIVRIQAAWRGYKVRAASGRAGRDARRRLAAASAAAAAAPHKRIGVRAREALTVLLGSKQCSQVIAAVAAIAHSTRYSKACCALMVDSGGVEALLAFMRSCNRSKPHMEMLAHALDILANICRWRDLLPAVVATPDVVAVLTERLQMFRDVEEIFLAGVAILQKLVAEEGHALVVARAAGGTFVKQWEGIGALIGRKMDMERKYIARLEGQKGSDVTAREATRKMVSAAKQLEALHQVVTRVVTVADAHGVPLVRLQTSSAAWAPVDAGDAHVPGAAEVAQPAGWQPKNTIVRGVFKEIATNQVWGVPAGAAPGAGGAAGAAAAAPGGSSSAAAAAAEVAPGKVAQLLEAPGTAQKLLAGGGGGGRGGGGALQPHLLGQPQQEPSAAMVGRLQDMLACLPDEEQQQVLPYLTPSKLPQPPAGRG